MNALAKAINTFESNLQPLGPVEDEAARRRKKLTADLRKILDGSDKLAWIIIILLIILLLSNLWFIFFAGDLAAAKIAIGLLGISSAGCVKWLHAIWSQKTATSLLLELALVLEGDALKKIVNVLGERARRGT